MTRRGFEGNQKGNKDVSGKNPGERRDRSRGVSMRIGREGTQQFGGVAQKMSKGAETLSNRARRALLNQPYFNRHNPRHKKAA